MSPFVFQVLGLVALIIGLYVGYVRWIKPHQNAIGKSGQGLLLLVTLTLMGGFLGAPAWWLDAQGSFSWDLPPLASRMLAAAGWSFAVISFLALQRPTYERLRLVLTLLLVYLAPLAAAIILFHLDRFDPTAPITYAFFAIVFLMIIPATGYLIWQPEIIPEDARDLASSSRLTQFWLIIIAVICAFWGVALFVTDSGPWTWVWVWRGDLLSSRLIGVMLLTIAVGSITGFRRVDVARLMLIMIVTYGIGLALASLWNGLAGKPIPVSYASVFGGMAVISAILLSIDR
ncbi:MAG: hypothetical protein AAF629_13400 [Chloroflexota bacterium]